MCYFIDADDMIHIDLEYEELQADKNETELQQ